MQQSHAEFSSQLQAAGTRAELADIKRRLEAHQLLLSQWEEKLARQLELITELQSPSRRHSMLGRFTAPQQPSGGLQAASAPASPFMWQQPSGSAISRRPMAFSPGPQVTGLGNAGATLPLDED